MPAVLGVYISVYTGVYPGPAVPSLVIRAAGIVPQIRAGTVTSEVTAGSLTV